MKKWISAILLMILALGLSGCFLIPEVEPDISKAAAVVIARGGKVGCLNDYEEDEPDLVRIVDAEQLEEVRSRIYSIERTWPMAGGVGAVISGENDELIYNLYHFCWYDEDGNKIGCFELARQDTRKKPVMMLDVVPFGSSYFRTDSFDFDWLDSLFK